MTAIEDFIRARLAERKNAAAWAAEEVGDGHWQQRGPDVMTVIDRDHYVAGTAAIEVIDHILLNDPAHVLAEVEAKLAILDLCIEQLDPANRIDAKGPDGTLISVPISRRLARRTLALLALPYADREGYDENWRPA